MDREIKKAQFVIMLCTEAYYRRVMDEEKPGIGHGIAWESNLIYNHIYNAGSRNTKFVPIIFDREHTKYIPTPIQGATRYCLPEDYGRLYSRLIGQQPVMKPPLGNRKALPQRKVKTTFFYSGRLDQAVTSGRSERTELHPLIFEAQFGELKELQEFLGGKDEMGLRETFDIPFMLTRNIEILKKKISFIRSGKWEDFQYEPYLEGHRDMVFWAKENKFSVGPSGVQINATPHDVLLLVTTTKHQNTKATLVRFVNSPLIPGDIKAAIAAFTMNINQNVELMIRVMDERMNQDENYFLEYLKMGSPFYGVIVSDFAAHITPLKPLADHILALISAHWSINTKHNGE
jgi:hypothetical protein